MKTIPRYPNYEISPSGRVFNKTTGYERKPQVKPGKGYLYVKLRRGGRATHTEYIHRLLLETYVRPPKEGEQCRHLNGDPTDNRLENLAWGTCRDNIHDKWKHGTMVRGEKMPGAVLTPDLVRQIRQMHVPGKYGARKIARKLGLRKSTVDSAIHGTSWGWVDAP